MSNNIYTPKSHFFVEYLNLTIPILPTTLTGTKDSKYIDDAFGPVQDSETTKYRVTSIVRTTGTKKVFAITDGNILYQPVEGDITKVNIILKPFLPLTPLGIKYFVYRGVNKSDIMEFDTITDKWQLKKSLTSGVGIPSIIPRLWQTFLKDNNYSPNPTPIPQFLTTQIGYDPDDSTDVLLDDKFSIGLADLSNSYNIPTCSMGEHIGNFTDYVGLEIIIDHGDYQLEKETELFKFDLGYARKLEHIFDLSSVSGVGNQKKYKEYIHQFIDPAAFWGSHIDCGEVYINNISKPLKIKSEIYNNLVNKFQTKDKIYLYLQTSRGRSYNFYGDYTATRVLFSLSDSSSFYEDENTNGWPILIKTFIQSIATPIEIIKFNLWFSFDSDIFYDDINISLYGIVPGLKRDNFFNYIINQGHTSNDLQFVTSYGNFIARNLPFKNNTQGSNSRSITTLMFFSYYGIQDLTFKRYFQDIWKANIKEPYYINADSESYTWTTYKKNNLQNLSIPLGFKNTLIHQRVIFDNGKDSSDNRTKRRLYICSIVNSLGNKNTNFYDSYIKSGYNKNVTKDNYIDTLYCNTNFELYKGKFTDDSTIINSLSLISNTDYILQNKYFHLGITETEYNKLTYVGSSPPNDVINLPTECSNINFHLFEESVGTGKIYRKFKIGVKFEDSSGTLTILFPPSGKDIFIYTIDGFYFFSKAFSDYQQFFSEFSNCEVHFRTPSTYQGEFGFDWLRVGDNGETAYSSIITEKGFESPSEGDTNFTFESAAESFDILKMEYQRIPMQTSNNLYYVPWLNIFPQMTYITPTPTFEAELRVLVNLRENISKLQFDYDKTKFSIDKPILQDSMVTSGLVNSIDVTIKITCLRDFSNNQKISILAYPIGGSKNDAKLAGQIIICKNSIMDRKRLNFVLAKVKTDVEQTGTPKVSSYRSDEITTLKNLLYQFLIYGKIVVEEELVDVHSDNNYILTSTIEGKFIESAAGSRYGSILTNFNEREVFSDIATKFLALQSGAFKKYQDYYMIFSFYDDSYSYNPDTFSYSKSLGESSAIGIGSTIFVFEFRGTDSSTVAHEVFHCLGLYHTHDDGESNAIPKKKFVFPIASSGSSNSTDNIMSYNKNVYGSWKWQWQTILKI